MAPRTSPTARSSADRISSTSTRSSSAVNPTTSGRPSRGVPSRSATTSCSLISFQLTFKQQEGETGVIELKALGSDKSDADEACDDPEIIKLMISSFYHLEYTCDGPIRTSKTTTSDDSSVSRSPESLLTHAKVFAAAIKYQADGLRDLAEEKFRKTIPFFWNHEIFAEVVMVVFHSTPDGVSTVRDIVIDTLYNHLDALKDKKKIRAALCEIPCLAYILLRRKCEELPAKVIRSSVKIFDHGEETRLCRVCDQYPYFWSEAEIGMCRDCWEERARWE